LQERLGKYREGVLRELGGVRKELGENLKEIMEINE
jgi:hypothetical protein